MKNKVFAKGSTKDSPLTARRIELNLSVKDVAMPLNVTPQLLTNWFNLKYIPSEKYLGKLAEILQVTPEWIIGLYANRDKTHKTRKTYQNFWITKKKSAGVNNKDIVDYLKINKDATTINKYFTGAVMPGDDFIRSICGMFDIEFNFGKSEFEKIYAEYHRNKKKKKNISASTATTSEGSTSSVEIKKNEDTADNLLRSIYGNVSYKEFFKIKHIVDTSENISDLPEMIYGKVDLATFDRVRASLN